MCVRMCMRVFMRMCMCMSMCVHDIHNMNTRVFKSYDIHMFLYILIIYYCNEHKSSCILVFVCMCVSVDEYAYVYVSVGARVPISLGTTSKLAGLHIPNCIIVFTDS